MQTSTQLRHQTINNLLNPHSASNADAAIHAWEQFSIQVISIVGVGGFSSLYARSIFLTQKTYPWLIDCSLSAQTEQRFVTLRKCLEDQTFKNQTAEHAIAANNLLLITFTDIMASIIGDQLTLNILHTAWGDVALDKNGKEPKK
jgi:hypothetical protein